MLVPGLITLVTPIIIGFLMGAEALGSYMAGVTVSGVLWAIFQNNAGGAWDNAKKSFEAGVEINGEMTYKGSDAHKAAVTGDTVGDPFKDTSGPSMNILIKLTCLVGLVIAPILGGHGMESHSSEADTLTTEVVKKEVQKEVRVEVEAQEDSDQMKATITTTTTKDGETVEEVQVIEGTKDEIESAIQAQKELDIKVNKE